jgi:hypothetical protein
MNAFKLRDRSSDLPLPAESDVRLRPAQYRYRVEFARIVEGSTILSFEHDSDNDDLELCRQRVTELQQEHGSDRVTVVIWDEFTERRIAD